MTVNNLFYDEVLEKKLEPFCRQSMTVTTSEIETIKTCRPYIKGINRWNLGENVDNFQVSFITRASFAGAGEVTEKL